MASLRRCELCQSPCYVSDPQQPRCHRCAADLTSHAPSMVQNNFIFVNQNGIAAATSQRAASRRSQRRAVFQLDASLLETSQDGTASLARPILLSLDDRILQRFFSRWADGQTTLGCLASMPDLLEIAGPNSAMQTAILAVAYADLAVFERHGDRGAKAYHAYCTSLQRLQSELDDPNFAASDGYLAAVLTIDAFELLYMSRNEPLGIHTKAIARLLELHQSSAIELDTGHTLWRSAEQRILVRPLFCDLPPDESVSSLARTITNDTSTRGQTLDLVARACQAMHAVRKELGRPAGQIDFEQNAFHCEALRNLLRQAQDYSEHITLISQSKRVVFDVSRSMELHQIFPTSTVITYNNLRLARDQLYLTVCIVKILDTLAAARTQDFSDRFGGSSVFVDSARDFLLDAQLDLALTQETCRSILDSIPFLIGLVDSSGTARTVAWSLVDTGVITVKSPLKTIASLVYALPHIKTEAAGVIAFIDAHRHVVRNP